MDRLEWMAVVADVLCHAACSWIFSVRKGDLEARDDGGTVGAVGTGFANRSELAAAKLGLGLSGPPWGKQWICGPWPSCVLLRCFLRPASRLTPGSQPSPHFSERAGAIRSHHLYLHPSPTTPDRPGPFQPLLAHYSCILSINLLYAIPSLDSWMGQPETDF
jgi:hypothetical protein